MKNRTTLIHIKRCAILFMVIMLCNITGCQTTTHATAKQEANQQWNRVRADIKVQLAQQQYDSGLFHEVVTTATEAISLHPENTQAYVLVANAYLELDKPATALKVIEATQQMEIQSADLIYAEGVILEQRDQIKQALSKYTHAFQLDSSQVDFLIAQAECLVTLNRKEEAIKLLDENGYKLDENGAVLLLSAHIASIMGNVEDAIHRYRKAMVSLGDDPLLAGELGLLLTQTNQCDEAIPLLQPLIDMQEMDDTEHGAIRRALAGCYLTKGDSQKAYSVLHQYVFVHTQDTSAQLLHAKSAIASDDMITALQCVNRAKLHRPYHMELWLIQATIQWKRGEYDRAATTLIDLLANTPEDVEALCLMAEVFRSKNQFSSAIGYFQQALKVDPQCLWAKIGLKSLKQVRRKIHEKRSTKLTSTAEVDSQP